MRTHRVSFAAVVAAMLVGLAAGPETGRPGAVDGPWVIDNPDGSVVVNRVAWVLYHGERYNWAQIEDLQHRGKALGVVADVEAARHGYALAFDNDAESRAWACQDGPLQGRPVCEVESSPK